jgi:hypothetical protein
MKCCQAAVVTHRQTHTHTTESLNNNSSVNNNPEPTTPSTSSSNHHAHPQEATTERQSPLIKTDQPPSSGPRFDRRSIDHGHPTAARRAVQPRRGGRGSKTSPASSLLALASCLLVVVVRHDDRYRCVVNTGRNGGPRNPSRNAPASNLLAVCRNPVALSLSFFSFLKSIVGRSVVSPMHRTHPPHTCAC